MDILQEYSLLALQHLSELSPYTRTPISYLSKLHTQLTPLLTPHLDALFRTLHASPAIVSLAALLLLLVLALQILSFVRRLLMFWVRLATRLVFWGALALLVGVVWQRGVGRTVEDLATWGEEVRGVWEREYERLQGYQNAKVVKGQALGTGGRPFGGSGGGRANAGSAWR